MFIFDAARACLEQCAGRRRDAAPSINSDDVRDAEFEHVNVLVTSGPLVPSLVKCLFFRLDNMITCNNGLLIHLDFQNIKYSRINHWFGFVNVNWLEPTLIHSCFPVYSSLEVGKLQCFTWIKERFRGPNVQFCVIGDGWEECEASQSMRWPFVQIDPQPSSLHRFPGLNSGELRHYFSIVYGDDEEDSQQTETYNTDQNV